MSRLEAGQFRIDIPDPPGGVRTDMSHWPTVLITPPSAPMSDNDYKAYLEWSRKYIVCVGQPYTMVLDNRAAAPITPHQRRILGEHMLTTEAYSQKYCAGIAMVFDSAVMRGIMTAIFWMSRPAHATRVFSNVHDSLFWCAARLEVFRVGSNSKGNSAQAM